MAGDPEALLEVVRAALQQKDYQGAIAHLETLCQTEIADANQLQTHLYQSEMKLSKIEGE
jgi:hypothetical protein